MPTIIDLQLLPVMPFHVKAAMFEVKFKTDSCNGHHHEFCGTTEKAVDIGCGKHIHLLKGCTSYDANHKHEFIVSTDMENPICK